jgi:uncharacterized protein YabN with tetrapyrrole methylase and pyrophosphatase domain
MVDEIMRWVHKGFDVCVAFYGHPGVLADPAHAAIRRARGEGFPARMLPGVSAEDGLFADLGVDPGDGCQSYEATDFLLSPPTFDHRVSLILWQVAGVGMRTGGVEPDRGGLRLLAQHLERRYGPDHQVVLYESSPYPIGEASIDRMRLCELGEADVTAMATLFVPPLRGRTLDRAAARALGVVPDQDPAAT